MPRTYQWSYTLERGLPFRLGKPCKLEFRGESFNATNTPLRGDPPSTNPSDAQFGILPVQQLNFSRNVQLGARVRF